MPDSAAYNLYVNVDGRWEWVAEVRAASHVLAFRQAMLALKPQHYDKQIKLEQAAPRPRPQPQLQPRPAPSASASRRSRANRKPAGNARRFYRRTAMLTRLLTTREVLDEEHVRKI